MRFVIALLMCVLLSGCASARLNDGLPHLVGKKIDYAIGYLGYPQSEQTIAGKKVYTWGHSNTFTTMQTVSTPVSGNVHGLGGSAYYSGYATSVVPQTYNYQCAIRLIANSDNIVERWEWNGNEGGCSSYSAAAKRIADSASMEGQWQRERAAREAMMKAHNNGATAEEAKKVYDDVMGR